MSDFETIPDDGRVLELAAQLEPMLWMIEVQHQATAHGDLFAQAVWTAFTLRLKYDGLLGLPEGVDRSQAVALVNELRELAYDGYDSIFGDAALLLSDEVRNERLHEFTASLEKWFSTNATVADKAEMAAAFAAAELRLAESES